MIELDDYDFNKAEGYPNIGYLKESETELSFLSFDGNPLLRPASSKVLMSKFAQEEFIKCKNDIYYFIENYVYITDIKKGLIKPILREYQVETLDTYMKHNYILNLSARRSGKSSTVNMMILHSVIFQDEYKIGLVANKAKLAKKSLSDIKNMYEMLPSFLKLGVKVWNKENIELNNGSFIIVDIMNESSLRGFTLDLTAVDEFSWAKENDIQGFMDSVFPIISANEDNKLIITTTPNGDKDKFAELWKESESGKNDFKRIKIKWDRIPGRDRDWYNKEVQRMGIKYCLQNHSVEFLGTGSVTLLDSDTLTSLEHKQPELEDYIEKGCSLYKPYNEKSKYLISIDTSKTLSIENPENDFICCNVLELTKDKIEQALVYRTNEIHFKDIAKTVYQIGEVYNFPLCVVEVNEGSGCFTANELLDNLEYPNMYFDPKKFGMDVGIKTTKANRPVGISTLKKLITKDILEIVDESTIDEFHTFIKKGKRYEAGSGATDDCVMSLVIAMYVLLDENNELEITLNDYLEGEVELQAQNTETTDLDFYTSNRIDDIDHFQLLRA